jgi:DNA-binding MarR family transcriptional regulator
MRLLWAVDHGLQSVSKRMESALGVTGPQRLVIRIVGRAPGISAGDLARTMHVHPSTLTGILRRLEDRRVLRRRNDPGDARRALFELTASGRSLDALRAGTVENAIRRTLAKASARQVSATRGLLAALSDELGRSV